MQFGVIKWIGHLPDKTEIYAGLEMVRHDRKSLTLFCAMFCYHTASFLNRVYGWHVSGFFKLLLSV